MALHLISKESIIQPIENEDLKMVKTYDIVNAAKIMWIERLKTYREAKWTILEEVLMGIKWKNGWKIQLKIRFTVLEILLGFYYIDKKYYYLLNYLIIYGKYCIFQCRSNRKNPFLCIFCC